MDADENSSLKKSSRKMLVIANSGSYDGEDKLDEQTPSGKSMGSFRLRFRTGHTEEPLTSDGDGYKIGHTDSDLAESPNQPTQPLLEEGLEEIEHILESSPENNSPVPAPESNSSQASCPENTSDVLLSYKPLHGDKVVAVPLKSNSPVVPAPPPEGKPSPGELPEAACPKDESAVLLSCKSLHEDRIEADPTTEVTILIGDIPLDDDGCRSDSECCDEANEPPSDNGRSEKLNKDGDDESFHFFSPEEEPTLTPDFRKRVVRSVVSTVFEVPSIPTSYATRKCKSDCNECCTFDLCVSRKSKSPNLSPETHVASKQGLMMVKKLLYPGLPKIFVDLWVIAELVITITQFVLTVIVISLTDDQVFNIINLALASLGLALSLVDAFIHFIQLGSCASLVKYVQKKTNKKADDGKNSSTSRKHWWKISNEKRKQQIAEVIELIRNFSSEIILYPLLIFDLFNILSSGSIFALTSDNQVDLSLFVIGAIFLVLSVYVVRIIMIVTAGLNLRKVPLDLSQSHKKIITLVFWFLIHVLVQTLIHASLFVSIGMNIFLEHTPVLNSSATVTMNSTIASLSSTDSESSSSEIRASFFLIYSIVAGLFITPLGVVGFFLVNYYHIRELSVSFWVDMVSMLQSENFAGLVFKGEGIKQAKKKAKDFVKRVELKKVKEDIKKLTSAPLNVKFLYPFRVPVHMFLGLLYFTLLLTSLIFLSFVCRPGAASCETFFSNPSLYSIPYFFTFALIIIGNAHVILLVSLWLIIALSIILFIVLFPLGLVIYLVLYIPLGSICFCITLFTDLGKEMNVLPKSGDRVERYRVHKASICKKNVMGQSDDVEKQ